MTREEEIVRSTVAALASTVTEVQPLRLTKAAGELDAQGDVTGSTPDGSVLGVRPGGLVPPVTPMRLDGGSQPRLGRRWRTWGAPAAAAALVIAVAITLVVVRSMPNGSRATPAATAHCTGPNVTGRTTSGRAPSTSEVPRYYVQLVACGGKSTSQFGLLVGDTFTGKSVASVTPPDGASFMSVSAAADDRTFAVFAAPVGAGPTVAGWWYLLRLAPGAASPARLTRIPVKPLSFVAETELSGSGREIAVGRALDEKGTPWLGIYSVATGRLLRSWSSRGTPPFRIEGWGVFPAEPGNPQSSSLTWVQGDQAITYWAVTGPGADLRRLDIGGGGSDIVKDSQVIWSSAHHACSGFMHLSADGKTVTCGSVAFAQVGAKTTATVRWLAYPIASAGGPQVRYQTSFTGNVGVDVDVAWVSSSGSSMLIDWTLRYPDKPPKRPGLPPGPPIHPPSAHLGIVSHGTFTPLKLPATTDGFVSNPPGIAW